MLTNLTKVSKHPNIKEVNHYATPFNDEDTNMFECLKDPTGSFLVLERIIVPVARNFYKDPTVKELYERRKEFDLFIVDHAFNEVSFSLVFCKRK